MSNEITRLFGDLEVPPRPKLWIGGNKNGFLAQVQEINNNSTETKIFRFTWTWLWKWNQTTIDKFEIFSSIQGIKSTYTSKWTKIGEIKCKRQNAKIMKSVFLGMDKTKKGDKMLKLAVSRRIAGVGTKHR